MGAVFTNGGLALFQARFVAQMPLIIDSIEIGTLAAADRYDALATMVDLMDATPLVLNTNIDINGSGPQVEIGINIVVDQAVTGSEIGFYSGNTLVILWANQADDVFTKGADAHGLLALGFQYTNGVPSALTLNVSQQPIATQAQAVGGLLNTVLMTPLRVAQYVTGKLATLAQAQLGVDNTVLMTALRVADYIRAIRATEMQAQAGSSAVVLMTPQRTRQYVTARVATQAQAEAGSDSDALMTPERTQQHYAERQLIITADPNQAQIDAMVEGGHIIVRDSTAFTP